MTVFDHAPGTWLDPATGDAVGHDSLLTRLAGRQAVLLGETHNRFDIHRWQLHVAAGLLALRGNIAMGFEMFPRWVQPVLDAYVNGEFDTAAFLEKVEWKTVWGFDAALYLPLFQFCRQFRVPMLALNCHRPLVTRVGKEGWDAIPEDERDGVSPSKPASAAHRRYLFDITGGGRGDRTATGPDDPAFDRFVRAQQTWDRAFACNIAKALDRPEPPLVIGIIGRGHLEYGYGTPYQLADLGIDSVAVLLPSDDRQFDLSKHAGIGEAVFRLDTNDGLVI